MFPTLQIQNPRLLDRLQPRELNALLTTARRIQHAARSGSTQSPLRGKFFGILGDGNDADAALFEQAVTELGGSVARIRSNFADPHDVKDFAHAARILGRLYDAVECQGVARALVDQIADVAGVPVFNGISSAAHPTAKLARQLGGDGSESDHRRHVLQAVLLSTMT